METTDRRCGTCKWWGKPREWECCAPILHYVDLQNIPDSVQLMKVFMTANQGRSCPTWEPREDQCA